MKNFLFLSMMIILSAVPAGAQDSFAPWDFNSRGAKAPIRSAGTDEMSAGAKALSWGVRFYRETISRVDGERCSMYPSCSAYSLEAVGKHGFFIGYIMTVDRLIHESNEMDHAQKIMLRDGRLRFYDPVAANDFWWSGK
jgi:hypothetical protein